MTEAVRHRRILMLFVLALLLLALLLWWMRRDHAADTPMPAPPAVAETTAAAAPLPGPSVIEHLPGDTAAGPLSADAHVHDEAPENLPVMDAEKERKMQELGYLLPPEYHDKDLFTLQALAKNGDIWALVHLGERYYFDIGVRADHPDRRAALDYPKLAKDAFREALARGHRHSAAILAEVHLLEKNSVDAYAWILIAEKQGDDISVDWFRRTKDFQNLASTERAKAEARAQELEREISELRGRIFPGQS